MNFNKRSRKNLRIWIRLIHYGAHFYLSYLIGKSAPFSLIPKKVSCTVTFECILPVLIFGRRVFVTGAARASVALLTIFSAHFFSLVHHYYCVYVVPACVFVTGFVRQFVRVYALCTCVRVIWCLSLNFKPILPFSIVVKIKRDSNLNSKRKSTDRFPYIIACLWWYCCAMYLLCSVYKYFPLSCTFCVIFITSLSSLKSIVLISISMP